jgi:putative methionine-R-sulfoxide reductase with GAF domain
MEIHPNEVLPMTEVLSLIRSNPWLVALAVAVASAFLGTLLWKILRSQEGFLFGYGNWVVGKWQAKTPVRQTDPIGFEPIPRRDVAAMRRALALQDNVLKLSRTLDGDLAYLMLHDAGEWEPKIARAFQTLVSGVTKVVHPAGKCRCGFFVLDDSEEYLVLAAGEGYHATRRPKLTLERSCAGRAFLTGEDYYCRDVNDDPVYWHSAHGSREFRSIACVPVRSGQAVFGVICLDAEQVNAFTAEDFFHLEVFAAKLAVFCAFHALQVGVCDLGL